MTADPLHERLLAKVRELDFRFGESGGAFHALRAVVDLHEPTHFLRRPLTHPICETCSTDDDLHDERWPCSTIRVIARELGVDGG